MIGNRVSKVHFIIAIAISLACAHSAQAETIPKSTFGVGNWSGFAYTNNQTGQFSHCAISSEYVSGDTLLFSVNADASVSVAVRGPGLQLSQGQEFPVGLYVDRRDPFYGTAIAISADAAVLKIPEFDRAMTAFRKGYELKIQSPIGEGVYDLTGTFRALEAARQCALHYLSYSRSKNKTTNETFDRTVLFQIATEMISELGLQDFRYFDAAETRDLFGESAVLWASEANGITGGVMVLPTGESESIRDTDSDDIAFLTSDCAGEIATTARNVTMNDFEARELRVLCLQDDNQVESLLTKTLVGDHVLYTLLIFQRGAEASNRIERRHVSRGVALRAASYVEEVIAQD